MEGFDLPAACLLAWFWLPGVGKHRCPWFSSLATWSVSLSKAMMGWNQREVAHCGNPCGGFCVCRARQVEPAVPFIIDMIDMNDPSTPRAQRSCPMDFHVNNGDHCGTSMTHSSFIPITASEADQADEMLASSRVFRPDGANL